MKIDGRCHCGFITYEAEVDSDEVYLCHCTDCQAISGSAFRWAVPVPERAFKHLTGKPKTYVKAAESGATSHQLFCPECASPLYSTSIGVGPKVLNLRLGNRTSARRTAAENAVLVSLGTGLGRSSRTVQAIRNTITPPGPKIVQLGVWLQLLAHLGR
jgi:hypothetical protein